MARLCCFARFSRALALAPVTLLGACYGDLELQSCTYSGPTACDDTTGGTASSTTTSGGDTHGGGGGSGGIQTSDLPTAGTTGDTSGSGPGSTGNTETSTASDTTPSDPPPWVKDVILDAEVTEIGPSYVTYTASADAVVAELLDDGHVVDTQPVGATLTLPITSQANNMPGSWVAVRVRDELGQEAVSEPIWQSCEVKAPGSTVWTNEEPGDGESSMGIAAEIQWHQAIATGVVVESGVQRATIRRYDDKGKWVDTPGGWSKFGWTKLSAILNDKNALIVPSSLAVDATDRAVLGGTAIINGQPRLYMAAFTAQGNLIGEEVLENEGTSGSGVATLPDGTTYITGGQRTQTNPDVWDMSTWVYGADMSAYGPDVFVEVEDTLKLWNQRGHAVAVRSDGQALAVGVSELLIDLKFHPRGAASRYTGKGLHLKDWRSTGDVKPVDVLLAATPTAEGFAACGYAKADPDAATKTQFLVRWFDLDLNETRAPLLLGPKGSACHAISVNRDKDTIVAGFDTVNGADTFGWIFAIKPDDTTVLYLKLDTPGAKDVIHGLRCDYTCVWTGSRQVGQAMRWVTGMIRG